MSSILMLLALTGGRMRPATVQLIINWRKGQWERWKAFLVAIQAILLSAYFYWRGVPDVKDQSGAALPLGDTRAIQKLIESGQKDILQQNFWYRIVEQVVNLILEFVKPSDLELQLLSGISGGVMEPPASTNVVVQQPAAPTAAQVRAAGRMGPAQGVIVGPNGYTYLV